MVRSRLAHDPCFDVRPGCDAGLSRHSRNNDVRPWARSEIQCRTSRPAGHSLSHFPNRPHIATAHHETAMLSSTAIAVENVNIWGLLVGMALECLDVMVLRMTATTGNLLVLLKRLDELRRQQGAEFGNRIARAGLNVAHAIAQILAPKSSVMVSPVATVNVDP